MSKKLSASYPLRQEIIKCSIEYATEYIIPIRMLTYQRCVSILASVAAEQRFFYDRKLGILLLISQSHGQDVGIYLLMYPANEI
ncbi:MAG: hypothetical protein FWG91_08105 [Lachnospiraceae bacterium]|nr:hypothetical protein [Lachnospiraceae bacterium]